MLTFHKIVCSLTISASLSVSFILKEDDCVDSGVTGKKIPDYMAFVTYHCCHNCFVTLGDQTLLLILGNSTAKFIVNWKGILVWHTSYPPFSMHHFTLSAGIIWCQAVTGLLTTMIPCCSYFFFNTFGLKFDDLVNNIASFRSIGNQPSKFLHHVEHWWYAPATWPATISPLNNDKSQSAVVYIILTNKQSSTSHQLPHMSAPLHMTLLRSLCHNVPCQIMTKTLSLILDFTMNPTSHSLSFFYLFMTIWPI